MKNSNSHIKSVAGMLEAFYRNPIAFLKICGAAFFYRCVRVSFPILEWIVCQKTNSQFAKAYCNNGKLVFATNRVVYYIRLFGDNIQNDCIRKEYFSKLGLTLDGKNIRKHPFTYCVPFASESINPEKDAVAVWNRIQESSKHSIIMLGDVPAIGKGLDAVVKKSGYNDIVEHTIDDMRKLHLETEVGLVHGDFHRDNIRLIQDNPILIDFDCARTDDIQLIDLLYFALEESRRKNNEEFWLKEWVERSHDKEFLTFFQGLYGKEIDFDMDLLWLILFIERFGQEPEMQVLVRSKDSCYLRFLNELIIYMQTREKG